MPFPAFPTDITRPNMNNHEFYVWFCQASGMGYILDRQNLSPEKVSSEKGYEIWNWNFVKLQSKWNNKELFSRF